MASDPILPEGYALVQAYEAMPDPPETLIAAGAHILSEWLDDAAPLHERRYRSPAAAMLKFAAYAATLRTANTEPARQLETAGGAEWWPRPWRVEEGSSSLGETGDSEPWVAVIAANGQEVARWYDAAYGPDIDARVALAHSLAAAPEPPAAPTEGEYEPVAWRWRTKRAPNDFWQFCSRRPNWADSTFVVEPLYPATAIEALEARVRAAEAAAPPVEGERKPVAWRTRPYDYGEWAITTEARIANHRRDHEWHVEPLYPATGARVTIAVPTELAEAAAPPVEGTERIVRAAIKLGAAVYSVPPPGRHHTIINEILAPAGLHCGPDDQGFLTNTGRFLGREGAYWCAKDAGQIIKKTGNPNDTILYSEDLW